MPMFLPAATIAAATEALRLFLFRLPGPAENRGFSEFQAACQVHSVFHLDRTSVSYRLRLPILVFLGLLL